ncbi:hypothetical protein AURDEDRAFT_140440 [Auricularia subglabra TFB-10046 SS5]|uniref:DUF6534 domain-containing protein n=1 Tax=Auricularia subglabra (strain TFB-10046 / SS5) TaxID=717982 RepID=J0WQZ9_AURST|nr:hypothetical protein AURDEDRAFT_140440 [Auricularia subglabra TFB-10046 SS5]
MAESTDVPHALGMLELGMSCSMFLTGAATIQRGNYFRTFSDDKVYNKMLVILVYGTDTLHTTLLVHGCYVTSILHFGDYEQLEMMLWSVKLSALLNGVVAFVAQAYYCLRLLRLTSWHFIPAICATLATARLAFNIAKVVTIYGTGRWQVVASHEFRWQMIAMLVSGAATDISLAAALSFALFRMRSGLVSSDLLIHRLISFAFGTPTPPSARLVLSFACSVGSVDELAFLIPFSIVAKLYNNSLLASLNERSHIRRAENQSLNPEPPDH